MQKFQDYIFSSPSVGLPRPVPNATVLVLNYPAMTVATIYSDNGITTTANPFLSAGDGKIAFYAADGHYSIQVSGQGINGTPTTNDILLEDAPADFVTLAQLAASSGSSLVGFIQDEIGAVARTLHDKNAETLSVKDFMSDADKASWRNGSEVDITLALQTAIDSLGDTSATSRAGVDILIPGPGILSDSAIIRRKTLRLVGYGWGNRGDTGARRSYLRWDGIAGIPMVKISDCWAGAGLFRLKLMGKTTAKPSAAVELNETNDSVPNQQLCLEQVYLGGLSGETDYGDQFECGIKSTGTAINNAEHEFKHLYILGCTTAAIYQQFIQNLNWKIDHLTVGDCAVAIHAEGNISGSGFNFWGNDIDFEQVRLDGSGTQINGLINVHNYYSEGAGRMLSGDGITKFSIQGGQFQITSALNADGKIVVHEANDTLYFRLADFRFTQVSAPPASPYLSLRNGVGGATEKCVILDGITGWSNLTGGTNGLDIATRGPTDRRYVYFREHEQAASSTPPRVSQNFLNGLSTNWDINRFHVRNDTGLKWHDDFTGDVIADQWNSVLGSDGACALALKTSEHGGAVRLTTGAGAGATMAVNGVQLDSHLDWTAQYGGLVAEARVRNSNTTSVVIFFGFTDQVGTLEMPFTLAAGDILTSNATDAVGFLYDSSGDDPDQWWQVGVKADVDATKQKSGVILAGSTVWQTLRVELSSIGAATFFINGVQVGTAMSNALTATVGLTPVLTTFRRGAASSTTDADYIHVESNRSL